jgi:hypothetical protein
MTGRELKPMRVRLREAKDREARKNQAAAARSKKSAKASGDSASGERAGDRETEGYPGSPEPAPASRSAFPPQRHPTTDEA